MKSIIIFSFVFSLQFIQADSYSGKVIKITDGDTIHILLADNSKEKIRLAGIDAPERKQAFGKKSTKYLANLVATKIVSIEFNKRDRYGRIVGKILFNGKDINLEMVKAGLAWHYKKYKHEQSQDDQIRYAVAENNAKKQSYGLWNDKNKLAPWKWRNNKKNIKGLKPTVSTSIVMPSTDENIQVWVNLKSGKYHCPETRYFKNTKQGKLLQQKYALSSGYNPAHGGICK